MNRTRWTRGEGIDPEVYARIRAYAHKLAAEAPAPTPELIARLRPILAVPLIGEPARKTA